MSSRSSQYVEVQLEIGHRATPKTKLTPEGHTHDWSVFVRGPDNSNIQHFVEKVVFHLHDSFPKPKRVVKEPPYQVQESGYASFELPVEVYFKNKEEPKKICFDYDLYLRLDDAVSNTRREKLTFQNPSNDFKKKLLKAGGVTNETSGATTKSTSSDEKQQTSSTDTTKYSKSSISGNESKRSKASGVIPSKDKSLNNTQLSTTTSSSTPLFVPEKHPIPTSNNKQFTDLFGAPIIARPPSDTSIVKNKESSSKTKCTAIASKGLKNDSKSSHKSSNKNSHSSPSHKVMENKTGKESKGTNKTKESTKTKHDEEETSSKQKKKSLLSPAPNESIDKKSNDFKASKKRRTSTSSNSSSITCSSFGGNAESKSRKDHSPKVSSNKDYDSKKESKKQKISSKDMNSASGVKKQSLTSTKISFSNNNSSTTIEIKSVKKEKTWDNEVKKSKSKEFKSAKENLNNNNSSSSSASQNLTKTKVKDESKSPKVNGSKNLKVPKDKYSSNSSTHREVSSSPSSGISGSLTPGGVALSSSSSIHGPISSMMADMDSQESMSPLSSDTTSTPIRFERSNRDLNNDVNDRLVSDDSDSDDSPKPTKHSIKSSHSRDLSLNNKSQNESSKLYQTNKRKRDSSKEAHKLCDQSRMVSRDESSSSPAHSTCLNFHDSVVLNDLIDIQKRISESTNTDLLQKIVDTIEESGFFTVTTNTFDFDLMKLDKTTIRKLKTFLS